MRYDLVIPGKPFAKQRPRATRMGRVYTPKETVSFERTVATIAAEAIKAPLVGPIRLTVVAWFAPAASWSAKKKAATIYRPHMQRPDLDNIVKAIEDGLNRIAFADDAQVVELIARKRWMPQDQTVVTIETLEAADGF